MNQHKLPTHVELPSSRQLLRSTLLAVITASVLLFTTILPAEYGIDPTGVGTILGLTQMGEIKITLAKEAKAAEQKSQNIASERSVAVTTIDLTSPAPVINENQQTIQNTEGPAKAEKQPKVAKVTPINKIALPTDVLSIILNPGEAAEIKLAMVKGARVTYHWTTDKGHVNYDTHGDAAEIDYYGYSRDKRVKGDSGVLQAAFDGQHGWFWRNRSKVNVTITLNTEGDYKSIKRLL